MDEEERYIIVQKKSEINNNIDVESIFRKLEEHRKAEERQIRRIKQLILNSRICGICEVKCNDTGILKEGLCIINVFDISITPTYSILLCERCHQRYFKKRKRLMGRGVTCMQK